MRLRCRRGERDPGFSESSSPVALGFRPFRLCRGDRYCDDSSSLDVDGVRCLRLRASEHLARLRWQAFEPCRSAASVVFPSGVTGALWVHSPPLRLVEVSASEALLALRRASFSLRVFTSACCLVVTCGCCGSRGMATYLGHVTLVSIRLLITEPLSLGASPPKETLFPPEEHGLPSFLHR